MTSSINGNAAVSSTARAACGMPDDHVTMNAMIKGYRISQIVSVAAAYSLPEHMSQGPVTPAEIAAAESLNINATQRFMRACVSVGLMTYDERSNRFAGTSLLGTLHNDDPRSLRSRAQLQTLEPFWLSFGRLAESLKTGEPQTVAATGRNLWTYLENHPEKAAIFDDTMKGFYPAFEADAVERIDTRSVGMVVDVGGSRGSFVHALMQKNPQLLGAVFDLPHTATKAGEAACEFGLEARFSTVAGDFFKDALPSADLYLLRFILHDWNDDACIAILRNCRRSISSGGRLLVSEVLVGKNGEAPSEPLMDLMMMVSLGGKERSEKEIDALLVASGFRLTSVQPTATPFSLIEAVPV